MSAPVLDEASPDVDPIGDAPEAEAAEAAERRRLRIDWRRAVAFGVLPALALVLAVAGGVFKVFAGAAEVSDVAGAEAIQAAKDGAVAMLSYRPDTAAQERDRVR